MFLRRKTVTDQLYPHFVLWVHRTLFSFPRTRFIESSSTWKKYKSSQDSVESSRVIFLVYFDKMLPKFYQDLSWNVGIAGSRRKISDFARDVKIMHVLSRCIMFHWEEFILFSRDFAYGTKWFPKLIDCQSNAVFLWFYDFGPLAQLNKAFQHFLHRKLSFSIHFYGAIKLFHNGNISTL